MNNWPVLIVDDDPGSAEYMALVLEQHHYSTRKAADAHEALRSIEHEHPDLVITDLRMPGTSGVGLLRIIRERWPALPVMLATVEEDVATVVAAMQLGAVNYLLKPVSPPVLVAAVAKALAHKSAPGPGGPDVVARLLVGSNPEILNVRRLIALASRSDVNVLVVGETGTGKELVARAIHQLSGPPNRPFVAHNCALTSSDMFDSEFFGHLRGSFTGAHRDQTGLLREADGGSLMLDELECLGLANQAKLLRVMDDGAVRPIGATRSFSVSVRFIAATNRPPEAMLAHGELRHDLYYRLRGFEIRLPPLRERKEDIGSLAEHFLRGTGKTITPGAVSALRSCSWPGNVRQLSTVLTCAAARQQESATIDVDQLDLQIPGGFRNPSVPPAKAWRLPSTPPTHGRMLQTLEFEAILRVLDAHNGNRSRTARALGIHRSTLLRRLRQLEAEANQETDPSSKSGGNSS